MKLSVGTPRQTLASIHGFEVPAFNAFLAWARKQQDGPIRVLCGATWMAVARDSISFCVRDGTVVCDHPRFLAKPGADPVKVAGIVCYEAWKRARALNDFFRGIDALAIDVIAKATNTPWPQTLGKN